LQTPIQAKWPGFQYVSFDDLESLNDAMSDQTAFILTSPNDPSGAGRVLSNDYLRAVRELADQHELLWIADDRMTVAGSSGCISATQSLSDSSPDVVLLRGGLMANESGGLAIGNEAWFESAQSSSSLVPWSVANPWLVSVVEWSLGLISNEGTISRANDHFQSVVRSIASSLGSGSVVRDVHPLGGTIGLETDLPTNEVLSELSKSGIIAEPAGPNGILLHLPMDSSSEPSWVAAFANALQLTHEAAGETT
ncbi:MAG: aminotransferase class III-fold pyridoxal phosphate-dependent enzyme, partial [Planctomycetota bacterium]